MKKSNNVRINVGFLFDKKNSWISKFINKKKFKDSIKYKYTFSFNEKKFHNYDIIFILGYTRILKDNFLKRNKLNVVCHESDLPKGKGFSPVQWQIIENKKKIPVCLIEASKKIDSGPILEKGFLYLDGTELYDQIRKKQAESSVKIIRKFLNKYPNIKKINQKGSSTYYRKRTTESSKLNINKTIKNQFNILRVSNNRNWPAYFIYKNKKYKISIHED